MANEKPGVGVGIIIENKKGEIFIGRRIGSFAQKYSIPGGGVELGETFEQTAIREAKEEHGIDIVAPKVIAVTNNLETYQEEGLHFVSVVLYANEFRGTPCIMEPDKCSEIAWVDPNKLPEPHFDASRLAVRCFLAGSFFEGTSE